MTLLNVFTASRRRPVAAGMFIASLAVLAGMTAVPQSAQAQAVSLTPPVQTVIAEGTTAEFTVTLDGTSSDSTTVTWEVVETMAREGTLAPADKFRDTGAMGTVTIPAEMTTAAFAVMPYDNTIAEITKTYEVRLTEVSGNPMASLGDPTTSSLTVSDNDELVLSFRQDQVSFTENLAGPALFGNVEVKSGSKDLEAFNGGTVDFEGEFTAGLVFERVNTTENIVPSFNLSRVITDAVFNSTAIASEENDLARFNLFPMAPAGLCNGNTPCRPFDDDLVGLEDSERVRAIIQAPDENVLSVRIATTDEIEIATTDEIERDRTTQTEIVITDDDVATFGFEGTGITVAENAGMVSTRIRSNVPLVKNVTYTVTVVSGGTAVEGDDYLLPSTVVTMVAGTTTTDVQITLVDDDIPETTETLTIQLALGSSITSGIAVDSTRDETVITITDDDLLTVGFTTATYSIVEGGTGNLVLSVSGADVTGVTGLMVTVTGEDGSAVTGEDYEAVSATVPIPAADYTTAATINVPVTTLQDALVEGDETFTVTLGGEVFGGLRGRTTAAVTIADDDLLAVGFPANGRVGVLEDMTLFLSFLVGEAEITGDVTVTVDYTPISATPGDDYAAVRTDITIPAADYTTATLIDLPGVTIRADALIEGDETFTATLSTSAPGVMLSTPTATITITDNNRLTVGFRETSYGITEGETGNLMLSVSGGRIDNGLNVAVMIFSEDGSATAGNDYSTANGEVAIPIADYTTEAFVNVPVTTLQDNLMEGVETFTVALSESLQPHVRPGNSTMTTVIIGDDDTPSTAALAASDPNAGELNNEPGIATLALTPGNPGVNATVIFTLGGTATFGEAADYRLDIAYSSDTPAIPDPFSAAGGSIQLPGDVTGIVFTVIPIADADDEDVENVIITVTDVDFRIGSDVAAPIPPVTITIADYGDPPAAALEVTDANATEAGPDAGVFTLRLTNAPNGENIAVVGYILAVTGDNAADADITAAFGGAAEGPAVIGGGDISTVAMTVAGRTGLATVTITPRSDNDSTNETVAFTVTGVTFADLGTGTDIAGGAVTDGSRSFLIVDDDPIISIDRASGGGGDYFVHPGSGKLTTVAAGIACSKCTTLQAYEDVDAIGTTNQSICLTNMPDALVGCKMLEVDSPEPDGDRISTARVTLGSFARQVLWVAENTEGGRATAVQRFYIQPMVGLDVSAAQVEAGTAGLPVSAAVSDDVSEGAFTARVRFADASGTALLEDSFNSERNEFPVPITPPTTVTLSLPGSGSTAPAPAPNLSSALYTLGNSAVMVTALPVPTPESPAFKFEPQPPVFVVDSSSPLVFSIASTPSAAHYEVTAQVLNRAPTVSLSVMPPMVAAGENVTVILGDSVQVGDIIEVEVTGTAEGQTFDGRFLVPVLNPLEGNDSNNNGIPDGRERGAGPNQLPVTDDLRLEVSQGRPALGAYTAVASSVVATFASQPGPESGALLSLAYLAFIPEHPSVDEAVEEATGIEPLPSYQGTGVFDFIVNGVTPGGVVSVLIPLQSSVRETGLRLFKYDDGGGWSPFISEPAEPGNAYYSAPAPCPEINAPRGTGAGEWRRVADDSGLRTGDECVLLEITDGGVNDADGTRNGVIYDPNALGRGGSSGSSGGGVMDPIWLLLAALALALPYALRRKQRHLR